MSNIFKRLRLIGRREEREEMNQNAIENHLEHNPGNTRGDFRHQRPRYRRSARKRLRFPSKREGEPAISCRKTAQEEIPHASQSDAKDEDAESCYAVLLKDDIPDNDADGTMESMRSADGVESKSSTKGADVMNESFEVLMPDLLSSNRDDLSTKKVAQLCNEATPDPPVLHRMDAGPGLLSVSKEDVLHRMDAGPGLLSVSKEDVLHRMDAGPGLLSVSKEDVLHRRDAGPGLLSVSKEDVLHRMDAGPGLLSVSKEDVLHRMDAGLGLLSVSKEDVLHRMDAGPGLLSVSKKDVLHRMDAGLGLLFVSKEDVDLPMKSPVTRAQTRKEEFQLLKLLCSDKDTTKNDSLPLLSISKDKRRCPTFSLGQKIGNVPLKAKDVGEESCNKKNSAQIERTDLNTPLGESNINSSTISLLLSRSSRRRKQEHDKTKECNDQGVTVLELESQRVGEDLNEDTTRNDAEKQGSGSDKESDKENNESVGSDGVEEVYAVEMQCKEVKESTCRKETEAPPNQISKPNVSAEADSKSTKGIVACLGNDTLLGAGFEEMQLEKGNHKEPNYQETVDITETTKVQDRPDRGGNESQESNELLERGLHGFQGKEGNDSGESLKCPCIQEKAEPTELPKVDKESPDTNAIHKENAGGMQYKEGTDSGNDTIYGQESAESTEASRVERRLGIEEMQQEKGHDSREQNYQENTKPTESTEDETRSEGRKESLKTGQEGDVNGMQFNEDDSAEEGKLPSIQTCTKATESPKVENRSERVDRGSQETDIDVIQVAGFDGMLHKEGNRSREPDGLKITEHEQSTEVENCLNGGITFDSQVFVLTSPQDAPISSNLSPTITPRKMYEMFAAPNSHGMFNGRWPMAEGTMSHVPRKRGRPRKMKTERQPKVKSINSGIFDAYNMPVNNLEWCRMVSAPGTFYSQEDGVFVMTGAIPQGQPQEFRDTGGYYSSMMPSKEPIPFKSTDGIDAVKATSSDSGMDSQGAGDLEKDPSGSKAKKESEDSYRNTLNYSTHDQVNPVFQPHFDGLYMIDSAGGCIPVHHPYGTMIPPPAFQAGPFGPYGYQVPINGQYFPNQPDTRNTNLGADKDGTSPSDAEHKDSDYSSRSIPKTDAGGDEIPFDETNQQTLQEIQDIHDALRILLGDAFDPSISDPGELLAMYGAELLKDEELRMEFICFCEQLFNYEMMMSQSGAFFPSACGDFTYPYPTPFTHPAMWPPAGPCPPGWYPNEVAYYYDGKSYIPIGPVQPDPRSNLCMSLPDGHPTQYSLGAGDYMPVYAAPDVNAVCV